MYQWLDEALREDAQLVTANRRLARVLQAEYGQQQAAAGRLAWETPAISEWQDWVAQLLADYADPVTQPIVISQQQSKLLWERCLRRELNDPLLNIGQLARMARDTWLRLREWRVPATAIEASIRNRDQRLFVTAANYYESILAREGWVDHLGVVEQGIALLRREKLPRLRPVTLAGFDRISPLLQELLDAYAETGGRVRLRSTDSSAPNATVGRLVSFDNPDGELRGAGSWARQRLQDEPGARIGIVVSQLEQDAQRSLRLVKEGLVPGWQNAGARENALVNVSYGRKLTDFPVIATALLALRWSHNDLATTEVSMLLRSPVLGAAINAHRTRAEMRLRQYPDQQWSAAGVLAFLNYKTAAASDSGEAAAPGTDSIDFIAAIAEQRAELPSRLPPGDWVTLFSELMASIGWPGVDSLNSAEFQTINRWRELLNEFARLELVAENMTAAEALARIGSMAAETIFQPESAAASVQVLGPLEAAGLEFDYLWVSGASDSNWPPASRPMSLVGRELQREFELPDATPTDTLDYAARVLQRLLGSAPAVTFSFPTNVNDAQQSVSELLDQHVAKAAADVADPGWEAARLVDLVAVLQSPPDPAPPVAVDERISGGAGTIQRQFVEPFGAFVTGRLGVRGLWPIQPGLPANVRGSLIHNALQQLYGDLPTRETIQQWDATEREQRTRQAAAAAFRSVAANADPTLSRILELEKQRVAALLTHVIATDVERDEFAVKLVEHDIDATIGELSLRLRIDRIDLDAAQQQIIIDYKTGTPKRLLNRDNEPADMQLIVYARVLPGSTSGVALFNIDSRNVALDGVGKDFSPALDWDVALPGWLAQVDLAAAEIAAGDVRIDATQTVQQGRPFGLLSRIRELQLEQ